ncbi:MAG: hypothetical protein ABIN57_04050 [Chitinophagaceae bacterium]
MEKLIAIGGGLAGAAALTLLHETIRHQDSDAPRMDLLGMSALSKLLHKLDTTPPGRDKLYLMTMTGDLLSNTIYYSAAGLGGQKNVWLNGAFLGLSAGLGAVLLPKPMRLNEGYSGRTTKTKIITVGLYLFGGLVSAATISLLKKLNNGN